MNYLQPNDGLFKKVQVNLIAFKLIFIAFPEGAIYVEQIIIESRSCCFGAGGWHFGNLGCRFNVLFSL